MLGGVKTQDLLKIATSNKWAAPMPRCDPSNAPVDYSVNNYSKGP